MNNLIIENELKKFNVTDSKLSELAEKYLPLAIGGLDDKEGYQSVYEGRRTVKGLRVNIEKRRKELKEDSLAFGRAIDKEAKRITTKLSEIEASLSEKQKVIDVEKERIAEEKSIAKRAILQGRVDQLQKIGVFVQVHDLVLMSESDFDNLLSYETMAWDVAQKDAEEQAEKERVRKESDEIERKRLLDIEQAKLAAEREESMVIKAKLDKVEKEQAEKQKEINEAVAKIKIASDLEASKLLEEAQAARAKADKKERERQERELNKLLKPDREKLLSFSNGLQEFVESKRPYLETGYASKALFDGITKISEAIDIIKEF